LFFANGSVFAEAVKRAVTAAPEASVHHVVVDMEAVTDVDVTGAESFEALETWLSERRIELEFSRVRPDALARLTQLGLLGDHAVYDTNRAAVAALASKGQT
jgi:MFS superfamily sulfate permease-like transporter